MEGDWQPCLELQKTAFNLNSLTTKKQQQNFHLQIFKNVKSKLDHIENSNSVDLDEVAHYEPPHQDLHCLQIQLFLSLVV